ncbi:FG-GAP-like repeat-containing protein, partial [Pseudovibrio denitrificans]
MFFKYSRDRHLAGQASGRKLKVLLSGALCAVMIFNPPTSSAQESDRLLSIDKIYTQRQSSFGAFTQKVPIEVPQYYGLEPSLSLSYSSSRVNSYGSEDVIGAGWRLNGLSRIKRGSPGMGAPFFNDLDQYFLDGERLVSCPEEGKKAGCAAGGSHASWVENYLRIKRLQEPNLWQVTLKNGTVLEYAPVSTWGTYDAQSAEAKKQATEYEWLLAKRTDTLGHQVNYSYSCTALPQCYISSVSYKTSSITFHWGNRPDPITYGVGYQIGQIDKRLTAVEVSTSGRRARAYSLSYKQSATTARSLLTKVQEYGKDATISNGVVTAGTKLPAFSFAYKDDVGAGVKKLSPSVSGDSYIDDIDSDRIIDSVKLNRTKKKQGRDDYTYTCKLETSSSLPDKTISCSHFSKSYLKIARNNNKKKKDVLVLYDYIHEYETSKGRIRKRTYSNLPHAAYSKESVIADFDGDGNDDVLSSKGQLFSLSPTSKWSNFHEDVSAMDINGDGLADLVRPYKNRELKTYLSNGTNAFINGPILSKLDTKNLTDLNGDGLIDGYIPESSGDIQVYYGAGLKFIKGPKLHASALGSLSDFRAADFDGDGRADYVANRKGDHTNLYLSRGNSLHRQRGSEDTNFIRNYDTKYLIDLNGDGFSEIVTRKGWRFQFVSERPDMLVGVVLPSGGQLSASYTTYGGDTDDERWFPPVLTVLASLTEKPNSSQAFTTRFAYSGGRWDFDNRRFAGFKKIITTLPKLAGETKAPTVETTYRQDVSSVGKIAQRIWKDGNGTILRKQVQEYATQNDNEPYTSLNTASLTYSYDEGVERVQKTTRIFNSYGQAKHRTNHGDTAKSGDERTYTRWSYPNKDKYIINKWAVEAINSFDDYDYTDRRAWRRWHYYDEKPIKTPPTKGLKTQTFQWAGGD